jgi:hypothetical protein
VGLKNDLISFVLMNKNKSFFWFTIALFAIIFIPAFVQDGMFLDGATYATIAKNMANGRGNIWDPHYNKVYDPHFYSHPPLVFYLESLFFRMLGDGFLPERIYGFLVTLLTAIGIGLIWRLLTKDSKRQDYFWLPVLLWLSIPVVGWSYKNNMLDNSMAMFSLFSVYFILKSLIDSRIVYLILGSLFIILAFLSKGFVGIFPLATAAIYGLVYGQYKKSALYSVLLWAFTAAISFLLVEVFPELINSISKYLEKQLLPSLNNELEVTAQNRFQIIFDLILDLSIPIILCMLFLVLRRGKYDWKGIFFHKNILLFLLIALSASIPLIITLKQRKFYLIPSIPFYAISIAFILAPLLEGVLDRISSSLQKGIKWFSFSVLAFVLIFSVLRFGKYYRNQEMLADVYTLSKHIPEGSLISTTYKLAHDWQLVSYCARVGYLSLQEGHAHEYYLIEKGGENPLSNEYGALELDLNEYIILKRKSD